MSKRSHSRPKDAGQMDMYGLRRTDPARIERALTQRIFLIDLEDDLTFHVLGSTGDKTYTVTFQRHAECSCPDYANGNLCKHIVFVWIRVLDLDRDAIEWELDDDDIAHIQAKIVDIPQSCYVPKHPNGGQDGVKRAEVPQRPLDGEACPICFEDFDLAKDEIVYCRYTCGKSVHRDCYAQWRRHRGPTCVMCRAKFA